MKAAVIKDGVVTNIIVVDSLDILPDLLEAGDAEIGDRWDGIQFVKHQTQEEPPQLTPEQARIAELEARQRILEDALLELMLRGDS